MRLYHTRCPRCAERGNDKAGDNLAVYNDGHAWCFSCGYYEPANPIKKLKQKDINKPKKEFELPKDSCYVHSYPSELPDNVWTWINQYFTYDTLPECYWSESKQYLIFLLHDEYNVPYAYTARYFGPNPEHPKWITLGISDSTFKFISPTADLFPSTCVLVEDILSGYKVGHIQTTLPIFGAHVSLQRLVKLKLLGYKTIIFWLDADKYKEKLLFAERAKLLGLETKVIQTKLDPKAYSYEEIREFLTAN